MRARRTAMAAATTVLALSLSGCASLAMLTSGSGHATGWTTHSGVGMSDAPVLVEEEAEGSTEWSDDDWSGGEETVWTAWEYTYSDDHDDAAPAFDLELVNVDAVDDDLELYVALSGYDANGWEIYRDLLNTTVTEDGSISVEGPSTMPGIEQVMLSVDAYSEAADGLWWAGPVHHGDAGWAPVGTAADEPFTLTLDLASGEATPATMDPDLESEFWGETESSKVWADEHAHGVPVATITLEGPRRHDVMVMADWWAESTGEVDYVTLWQGRSDGQGTVIEVLGPAALPEGATADEGMVSLTISAFPTTGTTSADCYVEVDVTEDGWIPSAGSATGKAPAIVLDTEAGEYTIDGEASYDCS